MFPSYSLPWNQEYLNTLIAAKAAENQFLDYKERIPSEGKDFIADVTSFANTHGGCIVFGVSEKGGEPCACPGVQVEDRDAEVRRLSAIISSQTDPPLRGFKFDWVPFDEKTLMLVLRIPQSGGAPHMIVKGTPKFYSRGPAANIPMSSFDLRNAFSSQGLSAGKFRAFVAERCQEILSPEDIIPLYGDGHAAFHIMPVSATSRPLDTDAASLRKATRDLRAPFGLGANYHMFIDGIAITSLVGLGGGTRSQSHTILFRQGSIEIAAPCLLAQGGRKTLDPGFLFNISESVDSYVRAANEIGAFGPWMACLSFINCDNCMLGFSGRISGNSKLIKKKIFSLPIMDWLDGSEDWQIVLQKFSDRLANYFGIDRSPFHRPDGSLIYPGLQ